MQQQSIKCCAFFKRYMSTVSERKPGFSAVFRGSVSLIRPRGKGSDEAGIAGLGAGPEIPQ